jgi:adenylate cyclase
MFTDMVGYTALGQKNESLSLALVEEQRKLIRPILTRHNGREIKTIGDAFLVEFPNAVDAVRCAYDIQRSIREFNLSLEPDKRIHLRIGVHVGEVVESEGDISGDAVNVASRIEPLAEDGSVCVTRQVFDHVHSKVDIPLSSMGPKSLKNVTEPIEVFRMVMPWEEKKEGPSPRLDHRRIAVLPFANMSPDPNDRYFADGMTEEIISTVSKISELQVISRTSVMRYKDAPIQVSQIGQELSVGSVLEGSVRKAGNKVRITAQLIRVEGDRHVWSQSYDRDLTDVFAIQADIAEQVAGSLKIQLLSREKESIRKEATSSTDAYTLYLKGRYHWGERTDENTRKALKYFEEATRIDHEYAMAYSGMADAYSILSDYGWMAPKDALPLALSNATRALSIDDSLAEAHGSMGLVLSNYNWNLADAEREFRRAIELKPNYAPALHWYAVNLFYMRRYSECFDTETRALSLDPHSRLYNMVWTNCLLFFEDRYGEALERYDELIKANSDMSALRYWRSICYVISGMTDEAIEEANEYVRMEGKSWTTAYSNLHLAWVYASAGRKQDAEKLVEAAVVESQTKPVSATSIGWIKILLGHNDGYSWLERAFDERDPALLYFNGFPWARRLRADPRWKAIEARFPFKSADE